MGDTILHTRGMKANEPVLPAGRIGVILDDRQIIAGGNDGNIYAARQEDVDELKNKMDQLLNSAGGGKINFIINSDFYYSRRSRDFKAINNITFPKDRFYLVYVGNDVLDYCSIPNGIKLYNGDGSKWTLGQSLDATYVNILKSNKIVFKFKARGNANINQVIQYNANAEITPNGNKTSLSTKMYTLSDEWIDCIITVEIPDSVKGLTFEIQSVINSDGWIETKEWQVELVDNLDDIGGKYIKPDPRIELTRCKYFYKVISPCLIPFIVNNRTGYIILDKENNMRTTPICHVPDKFYLHYQGEASSYEVTPGNMTVSSNSRCLSVTNMPSSYNGRTCVLTSNATSGTFSGSLMFIELDAELI